MLQRFKLFLFSLIPASRRFAALDLKLRAFGGGGRYYSQSGEDIILASIFRQKARGFYVDVGAHHPTRYSNTRLLYKKGWRGINIDANPYSIELFRRQRPKDINLASGVAENSGEITYWAFSDPAVNTFSGDEAQRWLGKPWIKLLGKEKVRVAPLKEILRRHLPAGMGIDLLNVDTEGLDLQVLRSNDWILYSPDVVVVEDAEFSPDYPQKSAIYRFLRNRRYKLYAFTAISLIFVRENYYL